MHRIVHFDLKGAPLQVQYFEKIQLVQTIGHLEFVLKHPAYHSLRELPRSPAVLCPSKPEALQLVKMMLEQVLDVQLDAAFVHIGADEHINLGS
ncbi:hypothetical protein MSG28_004347 [Choristoneura fumiferana]|uniref:Uncharacterized protein n=1 Tax=Choristoneura fumiferana TaxID=7141 RepID=A0ACC0KIJ7_CHOFU|nr:hypothetical protein MSG28_004347 [Choristoneura fumiferana]